MKIGNSSDEFKTPPADLFGLGDPVIKPRPGSPPRIRPYRRRTRRKPVLCLTSLEIVFNEIVDLREAHGAATFDLAYRLATGRAAR